MRWVSGEKGSVRKREGELPLSLLTTHSEWVRDYRASRVQYVLIKVRSSCHPPLELFLKSIDLLTISFSLSLHHSDSPTAQDR